MRLGLLFLFLTASCQMVSAQINIVGLTVEYEEHPIGIDVQRPRFSWRMTAPTGQRGAGQSAYQIIVTDEAGKISWNSGKVESEHSLAIEYNGSRLSPRTKYQWAVEVWDNTNKSDTATSWFETGLMIPNMSAWNDAKWIGGEPEDLVLFAQYLPVFKLNYRLQLTSKSTRAGFVYGANDMRLMDKNKNQYHLQSSINGSCVIIELDITPLTNKQKARLNIYRIGYHPSDKWQVPYKTEEIPSTIVNETNKYEMHSIFVTSELGITQVFLGGTGKENLITEVNLNPLGKGGDFITFPVLGDIGFSVPKGQSAVFSDVEIRNFRAPSNVLFNEAPGSSSIFSNTANVVHTQSGQYQISAGAANVLVTADPSKKSMPMLRTSFTTRQRKIAKARLYVTARGVYDIYMNGLRVNEDYFNPGLTQYNKSHLYQTYDVTAHMRSDKNVLGAVLAEGWWSGGATYTGANWNFFGDRQSLLSKLVVTYDDKTEDVIVSAPGSWQYFDNGPVVYGSFFQGEVYDARKEEHIEKWSTPEYDASLWKSAVEVNVEGNVSASPDEYRELALVGQLGATVKKVKELTAISMEEVRPGVFLYDMGQNMVGVPNIKLTGVEAGKKVVLRFAEVRYPDLPGYRQHVGMVMLENIRAAMAQEIYITKGGIETIAPRFTFHGYRFVEITGLKEPLPVTAVKGDVISSVHTLASAYTTSNQKVNKLWTNITWSMLGNFLSIPTDCPQRNERLGWSGDISVFARTATQTAQVDQFLRRHMRAMRDSQQPDGRFTDVAPLGVGFGGLMWGSAGITVPWENYLQYNDRQMVAEHYAAMKHYVEFIHKKYIDPETNILTHDDPHFWGNLGDWLGPEQTRNDNSLLWEAYFLFDLAIMKEFAAALGKSDDAKQFETLYLQRKKFFNETYIDTQTGKTIRSAFKQSETAKVEKGDLIDTQTSYVLPLAFDIVNPELKKLVVDNLVTTITRSNKSDDGQVCPPYSLMTGFIGTAWIGKALSDNGHSAVAYKLLQQTSFPSWLYPVDQGATTIWERLNSYTHTDGFGGNNGMNSFNHYSFGAVAAWMYNYSLGIERDQRSPGFKHFFLHPEVDPSGQMTFAKGYYESMYGRIESEWEMKGDKAIYHFVVPANTTATVFIPASRKHDVTEGGTPVSSKRGVQFVKFEEGKAIYEVRAGTNMFEV